MDAIELLKADHREVENLFKRFEDADDHLNEAIFADMICTNLTVHMMVEEELFYPKAREVLGKDDKDKLVEHAEKEHGMAKTLIEKIKTMDTGLMLDAAMKALKLAIEHHVKDEENEMFPKLRELGMETLELGKQMQERKTQLKSTLK